MTNNLFDPNKDLIRRFNSQNEFASYLATIPACYKHPSYAYNPKDCGGTFDQALAMFQNGDTVLAEKAQEIISKMADQSIFSIGRPALEHSVVGFIPNVPAAIIGHPKSMYRSGTVNDINLSAPLNVYVETTVSWGLKPEELIARGTAILAFVLAMNNVRPIDLYAISCGDYKENKRCYGTCVQIDSRPLDISRAAFMLVSPMYYRALCFTAGHEISKMETQTGIPWPWGKDPKDEIYINSMRKALNMNADDIWLPGGHLFDRKMLEDPVNWVRDMISKHANAETWSN